MGSRCHKFAVLENSQSILEILLWSVMPNVLICKGNCFDVDIIGRAVNFFTDID